MEKLKNEHFDVAFGDVFDPCFFGLVDKLEIKTHITAFATTVYDNLIGRLGVPATPSFAPGNFYESLKKSMHYSSFAHVYWPQRPYVDRGGLLFRKFAGV